MKKKVIGIAAGIILLAAAGGYAGVGHYYASHFFPKTAINGLNCAGLTAEQVKEEIQKHIVDYTLSITERGGKTETLSGTEIGLTYVDDHAVEKLLESQNTLAWPAFYWKEKENQVAADSVYDKEMVQEKLQTMEGFQEEQQEAVLRKIDELNAAAEKVSTFLRLYDLKSLEEAESKLNELIASDAKEAVRAAFSDGKLTESMRQWAQDFAMNDLNAFQAWSDAAPRIVPDNKDTEEAPAREKEDAEELTPEENKIVRLLGLTEKQLKAMKKKKGTCK